MKVCTKCGSEKPFSDFPQKRGKLDSRCRECKNAYYREYWKNTEAYEKHKQRIRASKKRNPQRERARKYGITEEDISTMLAENNGKCVICNIRESKVIDHCHKSNVVRGALCSQCNTGLGLFLDNEEILNAAIEYLCAGGQKVKAPLL